MAMFARMSMLMGVGELRVADKDHDVPFRIRERRDDIARPDLVSFFDCLATQAFGRFRPGRGSDGYPR